MGIVLAIVGTFVTAVVGALAYKAWEDDNKGLMGAMVALCVVLLLLTALVSPSLHIVDAGEVAVVKSFGQTKEVKSAGLHFDFW